MIEFSQLASLPAPRRLVLALGVFDAVHLGHREILAATVKLAREKAATPAAVTFYPHPREVIGGAAPELLLPPEIRERELRCAGAELVGAIRFDAEFARMPPEIFVARLIDEADFELAGVVVGSRWRFGRHGDGSAELLARELSRRGIDFIPCPEKTRGGVIISASAIRQSIREGDLSGAREMLGRRVALYGKVVHGFAQAGGILHTPTANLELSAGVLPPRGVYSGRVRIDGQLFPAAVNIGVAPSFGRRPERIEVHVLDFSGDLYDKTLELELDRQLRAERKFSDLTKLKAQIDADLASVRADFVE